MNVVLTLISVSVGILIGSYLIIHYDGKCEFLFN
jgi:hypothetical protein